MWKPWIIAAIGSILILNTTATSFAFNNNNAALTSSHSFETTDVETSSNNNTSSWTDRQRRNRCATEIEKACGPAKQQSGKVVIYKRGVF